MLACQLASRFISGSRTSGSLRSTPALFSGPAEDGVGQRDRRIALG